MQQYLIFAITHLVCVLIGYLIARSRMSRTLRAMYHSYSLMNLGFEYLEHVDRLTKLRRTRTSRSAVKADPQEESNHAHV